MILERYSSNESNESERGWHVHQECVENGKAGPRGEMRSLEVLVRRDQITVASMGMMDREAAGVSGTAARFAKRGREEDVFG